MVPMDDLDPIPAVPAAPQVEAHLPPGVTRGAETLRAFRQVLANTLVANVTSSYLWFALTFWAYLETRSVMATAIIGGGFMLFTALLGTYFGTLVDRHRKKHVMIASSTVTLVTYALSGGLWLLLGEDRFDTRRVQADEVDQIPGEAQMARQLAAVGPMPMPDERRAAARRSRDPVGGADSLGGMWGAPAHATQRDGGGIRS